MNLGAKLQYYFQSVDPLEQLPLTSCTEGRLKWTCSRSGIFLYWPKEFIAAAMIIKISGARKHFLYPTPRDRDHVQDSDRSCSRIERNIMVRVFAVTWTLQSEAL